MRQSRWKHRLRADIYSARWKFLQTEIIRATHNGETIGYRCSFALTEVEKDENGAYTVKERQSPVDYFYVDKVEDMIFRAGVVTPTVDDWLSYFENHTLSNILTALKQTNICFCICSRAHL